MSRIHKSKRYDLKDMFNDNSGYLDDIITIDNPELEKHIADINTSVEQSKYFKSTSFLDFN